jgi:ammonia channel protein AmtB
LAGVVPFLACTKLKGALGYDDALDTFGLHAVGGTMGALLTGFLANAGMNPNLRYQPEGDRRQDTLARAADGHGCDHGHRCRRDVGARLRAQGHHRP